MSQTKNKIPRVFKVAGVSFYQEVINTLKENQELKLEKDPNNKFDKNAIKILTEENNHIGFVPKEFNISIGIKFEKIRNKYKLKVKNIHKWDGPTGVEVEFIYINHPP
tara:strand:+ start:88 stop:411 length:324 start_codon:yes stop_codon:yes gene_type:complete